jgi:5-methyltetrahydrofolate--homocysteine methyltransferase
MGSQFTALSEMIVEGNIADIVVVTRQALDDGAQAHEILEQGLLPGMDVVGQRFKVGDMYIPEVLLSARTMGAAMEILRPLLSEKDASGAGTVVIGTVEGDIHNIGKNLVAMMFEGAGFAVIDLGVDVKPQAFVDAAKRHRPQILAMSALLTTTMPKMAETVNALREAGIRDHLTIMAGGAPVTEDYAEQIGADGYAPNAAAAVDKAKALMGR